MSDIQTVWVNNLRTPASYDTEYKNTDAKIVRLVEDPGIKKRIQFDEISLDLKQHLPNSDGSYPVPTVLGSDYPMIRINDAIIAKANIVSLDISSNGFVPTISLTLSFPTTEFLTRHAPKDGDIVSTYISVNTSALNYLRNDFIITSCSSSLGRGASNKVFISGKMFIPRIDSIQNSFGIIGTSKTVFREVAKTYGLGFAYNDEANTDDYMNWICCKESIPTFLNKVIDHSWKDGKDFYKAWIDLYYNICFVNVNKFLLSSQSAEDKIDITFRTLTNNFFETINDPTANDTKMMLKIFTNSTTFSGSPFFIRKWSPVNNSSSISMNYGYASDSYTFAHNQNVYKNDPDKCFAVSHNEPNYDETKINDHIILRGRGKWEDGKQPDDDLRRVNNDYVNTYVDSTWCGIEYIMGAEDKNNSDTTQWSGNVHKEYGHAPYHNLINKKELDKLYIEIECPGLCLQVMRGEKVPVLLLYQNDLDATVNNADKNNDIQSKTNKFYSGFYIVDSIEYHYKNAKTTSSNYYTTLVLKRREWPTPEPVIADERLFNNDENDI